MESIRLIELNGWGGYNGQMDVMDVMRVMHVMGGGHAPQMSCNIGRSF